MAGYIGSKSSVTQVDGYSEAEADAEFVTKTGDTMTGNLDITGTVTSDGLTSTGSGANTTYFTGGDNSVAGRQLTLSSEASGGQNNATHRLSVPSGYGSFAVSVNSTEAMRIDSSGNLLVGTTTNVPHVDGSGVAIREDEGIIIGVDGRQALIAARHNSDGEVIRIQKNNTTVGSIGTKDGDVAIGTGTCGIRFNDGVNAVIPFNISTNSQSDNTLDLGFSTLRWDDIYATNGTIQTSDFNEKQDIASLTATEMLVGKRISALFKTFRWKDSVAENGDNARTHTGVIAQDVQAAFTAEGLDAGDYSLFISTTWWETQTEVPAVEAVEAVEAVTETTIDEEGNEVVTVITEAVEAVEAVDAYTRTDTYDTLEEAPEGATERTRMGIRYPELLCFVGAYNEQRFASIEARLTALEA